LGLPLLGTYKPLPKDFKSLKVLAEKGGDQKESEAAEEMKIYSATPVAGVVVVIVAIGRRGRRRRLSLRPDINFTPKNPPNTTKSIFGQKTVGHLHSIAVHRFANYRF
jgi:hypothetical protein